MEETGIRPLGTEYYARLVKIWAGAVRAAHHFLSEEDFNYFHTRIASDYLPNVTLYGAFPAAGPGNPDDCVGFMGLARENPAAPLRVETLFVDPAIHRRGVGSALLNRAKEISGEILLDVNEQNRGTTNFYLSQGFEIIGRSIPAANPTPFCIYILSENSLS